MRRRSGRLAAVIAALSLLTSGCVAQGLAFRIDDRVRIDAPKARSQVTLPVTVRWSVKDFTVVAPGIEATATDHAGYFGVFVDQTPQPPGKTLAWVARKDRSCRVSDGCPDAEYLAARNIYSTSQTQITFEQLPRPSDTSKKERHNVTIVLLDAKGRRIGESAFYVEFVVKRKAL
ncbi:MAG: hypothetical protein QOJ79_2834 [Actinomycetota bacterium]|nr:hypothetical protein [Actinomycetota bacterium]